MTTSDPLARRLADLLGPAHALTDPELLAGYGTDWTRRFRGEPRVAVRPGSAAEVASVVRECLAAGVPVVAQGGNTSLVGGATPGDGEVVLSTARLDAIGPMDVPGAEVTVGAGVTLARLNNAARDHGLRFGVDLASRDSATLGGMAATNAGGIHVLRHGMTRAQVAGMQFITAAGETIERLSAAGKDNTGYDLPNLLVGSEGTLGVITAVRARLVADLPQRAVALLGLSSAAEALRIALLAHGALTDLEAAEVFFAPGLALVCEHAGMRPPFAAAHPVYLLLETAGRAPCLDELALFLADIDGLEDVALAAETRDRERLWAYRERHTEAVNAAGIPLKLDVAVPVAALSGFLLAADAAIAAIAPAARVITFGHIVEGNLHVNVLGTEEHAEAATAAVLRLVADLGGSISAEHGIGRAKREFLHLTRGPADIAAMRALKMALDPSGILNPGVLFPSG